MVKFQKYEEKLSKYIRNLSKIKFKDKLRKLVFRIGIYHQDEFELIEETPKQLVFPCHLGVLFCGDFTNSLFQILKINLNQIFDSFFYDIRNLGDYTFSKELFDKGVKNEYEKTRKNNKKVGLHPTNKFYQILINRRKEEILDMILAITNLPIYSSTDNNILFLFGETHLKHRCSIVSTLTLKETFYNRQHDQYIFNDRVIKETVHEIGHLLLGSEHCENNSCVMRFSNDIEEIDKKSISLCEKCRKKLSKIRLNFNF
ncbi:MAG: hypothetical protein ACFFA6_06770 [Promethearchaeota archaeon]